MIIKNLALQREERDYKNKCRRKYERFVKGIIAGMPLVKLLFM